MFILNIYFFFVISFAPFSVEILTNLLFTNKRTNQWMDENVYRKKLFLNSILLSLTKGNDSEYTQYLFAFKDLR